MGKRKKTSLLSKNMVLIGDDDDDNDDDDDDDHGKPTIETSKDICTYVNDVKKAMDENDVMLVEKGLEHTSPWHSVSVTRFEGSKCVGGNDSGKRTKMNDVTFNIHLENIWKSFPEDRRAEFTHLDSICFFSYKSKQTHALKLIKKQDIFSKKYVLVPIVCWDHWRLVIFCHFGETECSKTRTRCILLLDSAEMCASVIEPDLRKFVFDVFEAHGRPERKDVIYQIPLLMPKVPQQTNDVDCGRFVLYFIKLFMDDAPQNFVHPNGDPYFMTSEWFDAGRFSKFCDKLDEESPTLAQGLERVPRRCSQRIRISKPCARKPPQQVEVISADCSETSSIEGSN